MSSTITLFADLKVADDFTRRTASVDSMAAPVEFINEFEGPVDTSVPFVMVGRKFFYAVVYGDEVTFTITKGGNSISTSGTFLILNIDATEDVTVSVIDVATNSSIIKAIWS